MIVNSRSDRVSIFRNKKVPNIMSWNSIIICQLKRWKKTVAHHLFSSLGALLPGVIIVITIVVININNNTISYSINNRVRSDHLSISMSRQLKGMMQQKKTPIEKRQNLSCIFLSTQSTTNYKRLNSIYSYNYGTSSSSRTSHAVSTCSKCCWLVYSSDITSNG